MYSLSFISGLSAASRIYPSAQVESCIGLRCANDVISGSLSALFASDGVSFVLHS